MPPIVGELLAAPEPSPKGSLSVPEETIGTFIDQIVAAYAGAGWDVPLFGALDPTGTDPNGADQPTLGFSGSAIIQWTNQGTDVGNDWTQGNVVLRPTYSATAINGRPGIYFAASDQLISSAFDASAYPAGVLHFIMEREDPQVSEIGSFYLGTFGNIALPDGALGVIGNRNIASIGKVSTGASGTGGVIYAETTTGVDLKAPDVVTGTVDISLASNEPQIRIGGVDVTATHFGSPITGNLGNHALSIGARLDGGGSYFQGWIGAAILAVGPAPVPTATVAAAEALLLGAWGL